MGFIGGLVIGVVVAISLIVVFVKSEYARSARRSALATTIAAFARMTVEDSKKLLAPVFYPSWVVFSHRQKLTWLNAHLTKIWPYVDEPRMGGIVTSILEGYNRLMFSKAAKDGREAPRWQQFIGQLERITKSWNIPNEDMLPAKDDNFVIVSDEDMLPAKYDHSMLIFEEDQFLAQHWGPVCLCINIPMDRRVFEQNIGGQKATFVTIKSILVKINVYTLSETVGSLKDRIAQAIHVPANKQKLKIRKDGVVMEDSLSLAHYNVGGDDCKLLLSIQDSVARRSLRIPNGIVT